MRALLKLIKSVDRFYLDANNLFKLAQDSGALTSKLRQLANAIGDEEPDLADELRELAAQYGSIIKRFNDGKLGGKTLSSVTSLAVSTFLGNQDKLDNNPEVADWPRLGHAPRRFLPGRCSVHLPPGSTQGPRPSGA